MPPTNDGAANEAPYRSGGAYDEGDNYRRYEDGRSAAAPQDEGAPGYGEPYHAPGEYDARGGLRRVTMVIRRTRSSRQVAASSAR